MRKIRILVVSLMLLAFLVSLPAFAAGSRIMVAGDRTIHVIDLKSFKVISTIPLGYPASAIGVLPEGTTAYVAHNNGLVSVLDTERGKFTKQLKVGTNCAYVVSTYRGNEILVTNIDGKNEVALIDTMTDKSKGVIDVGVTPKKAALTMDDSLAFINNTSSRSVSVLRLSDHKVLGEIPVGSNPRDIAVCPDNSIVVVPCFGSNNAYILQVKGLKALGMIEGLDKPCGVAFDPLGKYIYIANYGRKSIQIFKANNFKALKEIGLGQNPCQILMSNDGNKLFVALEGGKLLSLDINKYKVQGFLDLKDKINDLVIVK
jgi:DNA-binding beta-propeller fold protein YncE